MSENKGYAHPKALVDADWVQAHLTDPTVRLIEVDVDTTTHPWSRWLQLAKGIARPGDAGTGEQGAVRGTAQSC